VSVGGLEQFGLNESSFRRLGNQKAQALVFLRTYDLTPAVRRFPPSKRLSYMAARAEKWIETLRRKYPRLLFRVNEGTKGSRNRKRPASSLSVQCSAREILGLARSAEIQSVWVTKVGNLRSRLTKPAVALAWYCVRAFVVIQVEGATSGLQTTEDRFVLVRASSFEDAEKRLRNQWREYARPYLNSEGRMVRWQLDHVVDVYDACENDIDPSGTEVYSKLGHRRMRPKYVWRPQH